MKRIKLSFFLMLLVSFQAAHAQQLTNTTWQVTDASSSSVVSYFQFATDTLFSSQNGILFTATSTYQENMGTFSIVDVDTAVCGTDTGNFSFTILNNTLTISVISDSCIQRATFLTSPNFVWTLINTTTGISSLKSENISIPTYPNPTYGTITIPNVKELVHQDFIITSKLGKIVFRGTFKDQSQMIDLSHLAKGIYLLRVENNIHSTQQIIKL